jgi:hypothetical protein
MGCANSMCVSQTLRYTDSQAKPSLRTPHRLHRGGNRQVNACLHRIAVTQARVDPRARAFLERKMAEGKTKREARRALKRHVSDVVYRRLYAWAEQALPSAT